ncbi:MAG: hypothetical protein A3I61_00640 [Acidobacteria bacterium RIFCSPLOWO2_02_FULL_68_18]|nr:MAG: hypothetical protein A3I61_00640 [Acidobacteria bacterium RIFCSPLOWO2_02_FULL_68_18]
MVVMATAALLVAALTYAAQQSFTIRGRVGATDQEAQEGYFALDSQTMIVVKPGSEIHAYLRSKVGQRVRMTIEQETGSE